VILTVSKLNYFLPYHFTLPRGVDGPATFFEYVGMVPGYEVEEVYRFVDIYIGEVIVFDGLGKDTLEGINSLIVEVLYRIEIDEYVLILLDIDLGDVEREIVLNGEVEQRLLVLLVALLLYLEHLVEDGVDLPTDLKEGDGRFDWGDYLLDPIGEHNQLVKYLPDDLECRLVEG
jgi:hypothetical protein